MKTRYLIRFDVLMAPPCGDMSETLTVLLIAPDDTGARAEFEDFCREHPTHYEGRLIVSVKRLIKESVLAGV